MECSLVGLIILIASVGAQSQGHSLSEAFLPYFSE